MPKGALRRWNGGCWWACLGYPEGKLAGWSIAGDGCRSAGARNCARISCGVWLKSAFHPGFLRFDRCPNRTSWMGNRGWGPAGSGCLIDAAGHGKPWFLLPGTGSPGHAILQSVCADQGAWGHLQLPIWSPLPCNHPRFPVAPMP